MKTIKELQTINTKNLLRYYKAERKRFYAIGYWCSCGCGEKKWKVKPDTFSDLEQKFIVHQKYLNLIKSVLKNREHIK